jgi:hypothetical protein
MSSLHGDNILLPNLASNYTGFLCHYAFPLTLPSSPPFSLPILGGCHILTPEAPLIAGKAPWMFNGYISVFRIRIRMDPHSIGRPDPDPGAKMKKKRSNKPDN